MVLLAASLVLEAVVDIYLNWLTGTEPTRKAPGPSLGWSSSY